MSTQKTLIESSKTQWQPHPDAVSDTGYPGDHNIEIGCQQRIAAAAERQADAAERMAEQHTALIAEKEMFRRWHLESSAENERLVRSNAALRGHLRRTKRALAEAKETSEGHDDNPNAEAAFDGDAPA